MSAIKDGALQSAYQHPVSKWQVTQDVIVSLTCCAVCRRDTAVCFTEYIPGTTPQSLFRPLERSVLQQLHFSASPTYRLRIHQEA